MLDDDECAIVRVRFRQAASSSNSDMVQMKWSQKRQRLGEVYDSDEERHKYKNEIPTGSNQAFFSIRETRGFKIHTKDICIHLGHFPFVRTDRPENSSQNDNFTFNQNYPVKSQMACTKEMGFQQKLLEKCVFHCQNDWSGRSVLTLGKRPKEA